ncbi:MFS transporter [Micromonospora sp. NPDC048830]|uniref:MFS transporter n=1 Tax=Micromonospora sp. NPDC048830 TaxID=3364257 RepID=UPI0037143DAB
MTAEAGTGVRGGSAGPPARRRRGEGPPPRRVEAAATLALAAVAFVIVTGEILPVGLLGDIARGVGATEGQVGLTVSWYALTAAGTAVPLTRWSARLDRRHVLLASAAVFGAGHLLAALAPNVAVLGAGRGLAALGHGVFFAVAAPTAVRLAVGSPNRAGGRVMVGGAMALVVGAPLATFLGQAAGWRAGMLAVAAVALLLTFAVARLVPSLPGLAPRAGEPGHGLLDTLRTPRLGTVMVVTLLLVAGHFAMFTYVAPYADERLGLRGAAFTAVLLAYGCAAVVGSNLGGRLADRRPVGGVRAAAATFAAALLGVGLAGWVRLPVAAVPLLLVWGGAFSVLVVSFALAVLRRAPGPRAETANAAHGIVFQVGIVTGSALGTAWYEAGALPALPLFAAAAGLAGLALAVWRGRSFAAD